MEVLLCKVFGLMFQELEEHLDKDMHTQHSNEYLLHLHLCLHYKGLQKHQIKDRLVFCTCKLGFHQDQESTLHYLLCSIQKDLNTAMHNMVLHQILSQDIQMELHLHQEDHMVYHLHLDEPILILLIHP